MVKSVSSIEQLVEAQLARWNRLRPKPKYGQIKVCPVITISREPGTGGTKISMNIAETLGMDFISSQIIQKVAQSAQMSEKVVATLDEKDVTLRDDWLKLLFDLRYDAFSGHQR